MCAPFKPNRAHQVHNLHFAWILCICATYGGIDKVLVFVTRLFLHQNRCGSKKDSAKSCSFFRVLNEMLFSFKMFCMLSHYEKWKNVCVHSMRARYKEIERKNSYSGLHNQTNTAPINKTLWNGTGFGNHSVDNALALRLRQAKKNNKKKRINNDTNAARKDRTPYDFHDLTSCTYIMNSENLLLFLRFLSKMCSQIDYLLHKMRYPSIYIQIQGHDEMHSFLHAVNLQNRFVFSFITIYLDEVIIKSFFISTNAITLNNAFQLRFHWGSKERAREKSKQTVLFELSAYIFVLICIFSYGFSLSLFLFNYLHTQGFGNCKNRRCKCSTLRQLQWSRYHVCIRRDDWRQEINRNHQWNARKCKISTRS